MDILAAVTQLKATRDAKRQSGTRCSPWDEEGAIAMHLIQVCTLERPPLVLEARTAADLMTANPVSLQESATAGEAAAFLSGRGISAVPVINVAGAPVGVLSQTDLVIHDLERIDGAAARRRPKGEGVAKSAEIRGEGHGVRRNFPSEAPEDDARVRDLMTPTVFTVRLEAPAAQVVEDMLALRVHRLFVVDDSGVLVGVVTATDILRRLAAAPKHEP
jgi:CBS domain-containing protein